MTGYSSKMENMDIGNPEEQHRVKRSADGDRLPCPFSERVVKWYGGSE
jgi:hypothetical protein